MSMFVRFEHIAAILILALRISVGSLTGLLITIIRASVVCRSLPPTLRISVSPLEITDAQIIYASGRDVPLRDTGGFYVGSNLRPVSVIDPRRDQRQLSHHSGHSDIYDERQKPTHSRRLHFFDVGQLPASVFGSLLRAVEPEQHEEPSVWGCRNPIGLFAFWCLWTEVDIDASV
jgi:hypothetical protein